MYNGPMQEAISGGINPHAAQAYADHVACDAIPPVRDVPQLLRDLNEISAHVEQMTAMTAKVANELFGPAPPQTAQDTILNKSGAIGELHMMVERLRRELDALYRQIDRFNALV